MQLSLFNYENIIKYAPNEHKNIKLNIALLKDTQAIIYAQAKTGAVADLRGTEIMNSILNALDINYRNLKFELNLLKTFEWAGRSLKYDLRFTEANESKLSTIKKVADLEDESRIFNMLLNLFITEYNASR